VAAATAFSLILFGLLPALSFVNRWDSYLSFCLYSGNLRQAFIRVDPSDVACLPATARRLVSDDGVIDPFAWSVAELGVVSYPEDRIAINIARALARRGVRHPIEVRLEGKPNLWTGERALRFVLCPVGGGPAQEEPPDPE
jgi:hypothetical protein